MAFVCVAKIVELGKWFSKNKSNIVCIVLVGYAWYLVICVKVYSSSPTTVSATRAEIPHCQTTEHSMIKDDITVMTMTMTLNVRFQ